MKKIITLVVSLLALVVSLLALVVITSCSDNSTGSNDTYTTYSSEDYQSENQEISSEISDMATS